MQKLSVQEKDSVMTNHLTVSKNIIANRRRKSKKVRQTTQRRSNRHNRHAQNSQKTQHNPIREERNQ